MIEKEASVEPETPAPKFDVSFGADGPSIDYHFCREWDNDEGCYGTNSNHGFTFEEAKKEIIAWHESSVKHWEDLTYEEWRRSVGDIPPLKGQ